MVRRLCVLCVPAVERRLLPALTAAAVLCAPAVAGTQDAPQQPTFRVDVRAVQVDVIVRDRQGRFVLDLTAEDFELIEDGRPQTVDTAFLVSHDPAALIEGAGQPPAVALARAPRLLVLVFDAWQLSPGSFNRLKDAAAAFLKEHFRPGDVGGIVVEGQMVGGRLTGELPVLLDAVRGLKAGGAAQSRVVDMRTWPRLLSEAEAFEIERGNRQAIENAVMRACTEEPESCQMAESMLRAKAAARAGQTRDLTNLTIRTLEVLARGMGRFPGRKTVVFLSEGFHFDPFEGRLQQVVAAGARAGVTFYSVDARGLGRDRADRAIELAVPGEAGDFLATIADTTDHGLNSLAVDTGGFLVRNVNNFARALGAIADDTGTYYVLGYRPSNDNFDGSFRSIAVRVRRPGVTVRARAGYVADPEGPLGPQWDVPASMQEAPADRVNDGDDTAAATEAPPLPTGRDLSHIQLLFPPAPPGAGATVAGGAAPVSAADALSVPMPVGDLPADLADLATEGWAHYQRGDVEGAETRLARAAAAPGGAPVWVHYALGMSQFALWQHAEAVASWERVREARPDFLPVYFDLVDGYLQLDHLDRALSVLRDAESRWPDEADVLNALGVILVRRRAVDDARQVFAQALEHHPADDTALFNLARTYEMLFFRSRRYVAHQSRWVFNHEYWQRSWDLYTRYLERGGPHDGQVREGLGRLGRNRPAG